ncbi:MAG: substrate-binding domain-containing protein [Thermoflexales bacterium]|nr:substrate-binding domain-containing protein [Thermoflexales bacterium]
MRAPGIGRRALRLLLAGVFLLAACGRAESPRITPTPFQLRVAADASLGPLPRALLDAYSSVRPNAGFAVQTMNAAAALEAVSTGRVDLALVGSAVDGSASTLWTREFGYEGIAVIAHPGNPLTTLTLPQLRDIFSGARSRWSDVGAPTLGDIDLAVRDPGDSGRAAFDAQVMGNVRLSSNALILSSFEIAINLAAAQPTAISYAPASRLTGTVTNQVKVLAIDGLLPNAAGIANGSYPIARPLQIATRAEPGGEARELVAWVLSAPGQRILTSHGFVAEGDLRR